ncbi:MAG: thioredoxin domain-containing protein [Polyangiaceae bacterium]|nr:thioredoxin domain-containing protein [Polyangiaceae bacterium]
MNKGTALVGFFLSFMAGMMLMYGIDRKGGIEMSAEPESATAALTGSATSEKLPVGPDDAVWGNSDAPVTIIEFSDFQCPFCSRVNPQLKQIKSTYGPDKVRIVWKHNPLPFHKQARPAHIASQAAFAVGGSEAFFKFHDSAFANQKTLTPDNFAKWATAAGIDAAKFKAEIANPKHAAKIDKDLAIAKGVGATGTPAFRINGVTLVGAQPFDKFKAVIDTQLKAAAALAASGTPKNAIYAKLVDTNLKATPAKPDAKKKPAQDDKTVWRAPVLKNDPVKGGRNALVTIIEFSDFQCPFCSRVNPTMKQIMDTYKDDVRIVWKDNALPFHKRAKPAANLAAEAFAQGGSKMFWKAHDALFIGQKNLEDDGLKAVAAKIGLNWPAAKNAIDTEKYKEKIATSMALASDLEARGTPHFFVNGRRLSGAQPFPKFKALIDEELIKAKALVAKGTPRSKVYAAIMKRAKGPGEPDKRDVPAPGRNNASKGPANAKVVIQEFSDFQCPFCGRVNPTMARIMKEYGNKVRIVWRHHPLPFHKDAPLASEAAQEAFAQKGSKAFWAYHDKLFQNQKSIKRPDLDKYATELGLDMGKFKVALDTHKHKAVLDADMAAAKKAGVRGTPAFTINGYFLSGAQPFEKFDKLIKYALKN